MASRKNLRKGIAGLVAGLIAAIALLVIALPVMMQYQQHITKSYHIKEYATMLEEQKELEEKGLAACYEPSEGIISINNTLGRPVIIVLAYASDGENEEVKYYQPGIKIIPGPNPPLHVNYNLSFTLDPRKIKIIKLVTSRGTIIQPPYCKEIVKRVTYEQVIQYITKRLQGFPVNLYLGENQTAGISPTYYGNLFTHGAIKCFQKEDGVYIYLVNGTTTPAKYDNFGIITGQLGTYCGNIGLSTGPYYLHTVSFYTFNDITQFTLKRCEAGDYVAYVVEVSDLNDVEINEDDTFGCYNVNTYCESCKTFSIPPQNKFFGGATVEYTIKVLAINYVNKIYDSGTYNATHDPLKYTLVNSGYEELIVGFEGESLNYALDYNAYIFVSKKRVPISGSLENILQTLLNYPDAIKVKIVGTSAQTLDGEELPLLLRYYMKYYCVSFLYCNLQEIVMSDQKVVVIPEKLLKNIGVKSGDKIYIYIVAWYEENNNKYFDFTEEPATYTYTPIKAIINDWYDRYISNG